MEITFEKIGNKYVAEFEATADFNLHIERAEQGTLEVYQRGIAEGEYDFAWSAGIGARKVIDYDFAALVYPKYIKVVSGSEVLSASVNFNEGGGSGSGSGDNDTAIYYKLPIPILLDSSSNSLLLEQNFFSAARGYYDTQIGYIYGTPSSIKTAIGAKYSSYGYIDAFEFRPIQYFKSWEDMTLTTYNDMESLNEAFPDLFGGVFPRITAEEYWEHFNAE